jgi:lysophospholipase L1-like esterase
LLGAIPNSKGVVANIPDVTTIPFFTTVAWNAVPLDAATATAVNAGFAGYNQVIEGIKANSALLAAFSLTVDGLTARKVSYTASAKNPLLISDETLTDLGGAFDALVGAGAITAQQRTTLEPYRKARQATSTDIITLSAGGVIGTLVGGNPQAVNGVSIPLADQYVLIPTETTEIKARTIAFNNIIKGVVEATTTNNRLALADVNATFTALVTARAGVYNSVTITPNFTPPTGAFSEDGVHPNSRGYAFMANTFIKAINAKFGAAIPEANIAEYKGVGLPVNAQ